MSASPLPPPGPEAFAVSRKLAARIAAEIDAAGGWIGFDRYMRLALYAPGLGYYSAGSTKLGGAGDFVTAPELGDALARALAARIAPLLATLELPAVLELGAGRGTLAAQLLEALAALGMADVPYLILEPSADLAARQRERLARWGERVRWQERLPAPPFEGAVVANEVADALPVACFVKRRGRARPLGAVREGTRFAWAEGPEDPELERAVEGLEAALGAPLPEGYRSEIRLELPGWIAAIGAALQRGVFWLVDYGYGRRDYYRPERSTGTLICHYRHRVHDDPFFLPGLQDITAWVDFSAAAEAALAARFTVSGYTTQGQFLLETLGEALAGGAEPTPQALAALKTLVLPGEMGERFKVMLLAKGLDAEPPPGRDLRDRLL